MVRTTSWPRVTCCSRRKRNSQRESLTKLFLSLAGTRRAARSTSTPSDHRGSFLFWEAVSGEVDGLFENVIKTPGLWLMYNGSPWIHKDGETGLPEDWGIKGQFRKISLADAVSRFNTAAGESYIAAISSHLEGAGFSSEEISEFIA